MMRTKTLKKPDWLKIKPRFGENYRRVRKLLKDNNLHSVCQEASCPNIGECFESGTATFLILGHICTRGCGFCDILKGKPKLYDIGEPQRLADVVSKLGLKHVVITSVTRDDIDDGGARIFAESVRKLREQDQEVKIELLVPDFQGSKKSLDIVLNSEPEIFNYNTETVPRLYKKVRPQMGYRRTLAILQYAKGSGKARLTKSGIMVGLGEKKNEIRKTMEDIHAQGVDILTIGQYLSPSELHLPVVRFVHPDEFAEYREWGDEIGFKHTESGPLVRSSYKASHQSSELI